MTKHFTTLAVLTVLGASAAAQDAAEDAQRLIDAGSQPTVAAGVAFDVSGTFQSPDDAADTNNCWDFEFADWRCKRLMTNGSEPVKFMATLSASEVALNERPEIMLVQRARTAEGWVWSHFASCRAVATREGDAPTVTCTNLSLTSNADLWLVCPATTRCNYSVRGQQ